MNVFPDDVRASAKTIAFVEKSLTCFSFSGFVAIGTSGQDFLDRLRVRLRQRDRARADIVVLLVVDAEGAVNRCKELRGANLAVGDLVPRGVALAVAGAALDAGAGERRAPGAGEVVAAEAGVDRWRAAELGQRDD